jgi:hypothetical protein
VNRSLTTSRNLSKRVTEPDHSCCGRCHLARIKCPALSFHLNVGGRETLQDGIYEPSTCRNRIGESTNISTRRQVPVFTLGLASRLETISQSQLKRVVLPHTASKECEPDRIAPKYPGGFSPTKNHSFDSTDSYYVPGTDKAPWSSQAGSSSGHMAFNIIQLAPGAVYNQFCRI